MALKAHADIMWNKCGNAQDMDNLSHTVHKKVEQWITMYVVFNLCLKNKIIVVVTTVYMFTLNLIESSMSKSFRNALVRYNLGNK